MLIAPHPDDEALACSTILQHAVGAGAAIRVLYATDGDNNPWPQRLLDRKWRLTAADRKRWGELRRAEAVAALHTLGVDRSDADFLALPDQGLTGLLMTDCRSILEQFATSVSAWSPTHLLVPSVHDTHPDHNALAVILRLALANLYPDGPPMSVWTYAVHGNSEAFFGRAQELRQSRSETAVKEQAIRSHKTQLMLSRRRFLAYAGRPECFLKLESHEVTHADGPIRQVSRQTHVLRVRLLLSTKPMGTTGTTLFVLGQECAACVCAFLSALPQPRFLTAIRASALSLRDIAATPLGASLQFLLTLFLLHPCSLLNSSVARGFLMKPGGLKLHRL